MGTMTDACPQYRGDLAMAAVGRLGRSERKVLLRHSASCAGCRAALSELEVTARMLPLVDPARLTDTGIAMDVSPSGGAGSRGNRDGCGCGLWYRQLRRWRPAPWRRRSFSAPGGRPS